MVNQTQTSAGVRVASVDTIMAKILAAITMKMEKNNPFSFIDFK